MEKYNCEISNGRFPTVLWVIEVAHTDYMTPGGKIQDQVVAN